MPSPGSAGIDVLVVRLDEHRLGLPLQDVCQVLPAVATVPLPAAGDLVEGVMNLHGRPIPVVDVRRRLGLDSRPVHPDDHFVTCTVSGRTVALWVDVADSVARVEPGDLTGAEDLRGVQRLAGITVMDDQLVLVYDMEAFLDADQALRLDRVLADARRGAG